MNTMSAFGNGLDPHDARGVERAGHGEQSLVFLGVDVVRDDNQIVGLAHRLAQHLDQRGLARAHRAADADAQRREFAGTVRDRMQCAHRADYRGAAAHRGLGYAAIPTVNAAE
jgi:hypothetical protein